MSWNEICATVLLVLGAFFALTGGIGIIRMPDFFSRIHPAGKNDTLGQFLLLLGLLFLVPWGDGAGGWVVGGKLVLMTILLFLTAPTATHAIAKAAYLDGQRPLLFDESHRITSQPVATDRSATRTAVPAVQPDADNDDEEQV